jgi:hypothetical protein
MKNVTRIERHNLIGRIAGVLERLDGDAQTGWLKPADALTHISI